MSIFIHNTLTGKKEEFIPQKNNEVKMYVCGITPYDECHIGHARCYVVFDVIRRYLAYRGYEVKYVQNFTDIDDKIINRAKELGVTTKELSEKYIKNYFSVMDGLNVKRADKYPRVTENIEKIISLVQTLIEKGYAYFVDGDVYYSVDKFQQYGKLSHRKKEDILAGARVEVNQSKQNPLDFALWKKSKSDEPSWPSPWGAGRPGWHIECSVMSAEYLQTETLDIHGGGMDLIFPHHENEIAQSEAATGKEFCRYWIHNGFVTINQEKMSKSLGNTFTLSQLLKKYNPMALRFFLLRQHYSSPVDFSDDKLEEAKKSLNGIFELINQDVKAAGTGKQTGNDQGFLEMISNTEKEFQLAMDDDFNTAGAIGSIFKLIRELNIRISNKQPIARGILKIKQLFNEVLGIDFESSSEELSDELKIILSQREEARKNKDWKKSDEIRNKLTQMGYTVDDTPQGSRLKKI